jgi:hypothetical protein
VDLLGPSTAKDKQFAQDCAVVYDAKTNVMGFSGGLIGMNNDYSNPRSVFIRSCYGPLFEKILAKAGLTADAIPSRAAPIYILGTPGVGKSFMRPYCCHRLLSLAAATGKSVYILFQKVGKRAFVVVKESAAEPTTIVFPSEHLDHLRAQVSLWEQAGALVVSLVDVSEGRIDLVSLVETKQVWYFSSPNESLMKSADRRKDGCFQAVDLYMPVWTLEELLECNTVLELGISVPEIVRLYARYGGSARAVLEDPDEAERLAVDRLAEVKTAQGPDALLRLPEKDLATRASHTFFHVSATPDEGGWDFESPIYFWASNLATHRVAAAALANKDQSVIGIMNDTSVASVSKGFLIEALWFERFRLATRARSKDNQMGLKKLTSKARSKARLPAPDPTVLCAGLKRIPKIEEQYHPKDKMQAALEEVITNFRHDSTAQLLIPFESDMKAVDGILVFWLDSSPCVLFLQVPYTSQQWLLLILVLLPGNHKRLSPNQARAIRVLRFTCQCSTES